MVHSVGPQCADKTAVAGQESAAGQRFLIGDASLGSNPGVHSTIQHAPRISNRVPLYTLSDISKPRPQTSNRHERLELGNRLGGSFWGRTVRPCNLNPQQRDLTLVCAP